MVANASTELIDSLLRVQSQLAVSTRANTGLSRRSCEGIVEDIEELKRRAKNHGTPQTVLRQIDLVRISLTPSEGSHPIRIESCAAALLSLSQFLVYFTTSPLSRSTLAFLPNDVLSIIIDYVQELEGLPTRQRLNMSLASTNRFFASCVRPILAREIHLYDARQFKRLHKLLQPTSSLAHLPSKDHFIPSNITLSFSFDFSSLVGTPASYKTGQYHFYLFWEALKKRFKTFKSVQVVELHPPERPKWDPASFDSALGVPLLLEELAQQSAEIRLNVNTPSNLNTPTKILEETIQAARNQVRSLVVDVSPGSQSFFNSVPVFYTPVNVNVVGKNQQLRSLVLRTFAFTPAVLHTNLNNIPKLERFECMLDLNSQFERDVGSDSTIPEELFGPSAATLVHLSLRIHHNPISDMSRHIEDEEEEEARYSKNYHHSVDYARNLAESINQCSNIEYLEVGGSEVGSQVPGKCGRLSRLRRLVTLSSWYDADQEHPWPLVEELETFVDPNSKEFPALSSLAIDLHRWDPHDHGLNLKINLDALAKDWERNGRKGLEIELYDPKVDPVPRGKYR